MLAYDGSDYRGWQSQPDGATVQDRVLDAARRLLGSDVRLTGASRTDAGVHALGQVASLSTSGTLPADALARALNATLPDDVRILEAQDVAPDWNVRRAATGKRYLYLLDTGRVASPLLRRYAWHQPGTLDVGVMREALVVLRGNHDFSAFCAAPGLDAPPQCTLRSMHLVRRRNRLAFLLGADRFLHHMVRNIVGSAVLVGRGRRPPEWLAEVLASRDRRRAGPTAPAHGLTLVRVTYRARLSAAMA